MGLEGNKQLNSWKEIAAYLKRDVRTVARWERTRGLPVHRIPGGGHHAVFAYISEIDRWELGLPSAPAETDERASPPQSRAWHFLAAGLLLAFGLALAGFLLASRGGTPERVSFDGTNILAWDQRGRLVWSYKLPFAPQIVTPEELGRFVRVVDLDGDTRPEVLVAGTSTERSGRGSRIYCLSDRGKLLWTYEPTLALNFSDRKYTGPWYFSDMVVSQGDGKRRVWVAFVHHTWFPSFIVRLDPKGQEALTFVNAGWILTLREFLHSDVRYLVAGGVNSEYGLGALAVLKESQPSSSSPQTPGSAYFCDGCPKGKPFRYILFPRSDVNVALHAPHNPVRDVAIRGPEIEAKAEEAPAGTETPIAQTIYEFSGDFALEDESVNEGYWDLHRYLEEKGKLTHSAEKCPERSQAIPVRVWNPGTGWGEMIPREFRAGTPRTAHHAR